MFIGAFFVVLFVSRHPRARSLVMIFFRTKPLQMLSNGVIGKGKRLALQARSLRPTWFPRESFTPPLKMLFSEIPVASWPGNWVNTSLTGSSFCHSTQIKMRFYLTLSAGSTFPIFFVPWGNFTILQFPQRHFFPNSKSCLDFDEFITPTILDRVKNGSLLV